MKNFLIGLFVSIVGVFISLLLVEVIFRIFSIGNAPKTVWNDRPQEYFIHESSKDFRDYNYPPKTDKSIYRIAVIGDSFTFAPYMQFDDAFPKRLEKYLNLNLNQKKVEVVNYGVPAYSTSHEVPIVEKAINEGADFILMQITFNDPEIKAYTPTQLFRDKNKFGELELTSPIFKYWSSLAFAVTRIHNTKTYNNYVQKFFDLFEKKKTWNNFEKSWKKISESTKNSKIPVGAVIFPLFGIPLDQNYPFHPIHSKVQGLLSNLAIPWLDLYVDYEDIPLDRIQVIVGKDFHPNEIAHRMAAEKILQWFDSSNLEPKQFLPKRKYKERIGIIFPGQPISNNNAEIAPAKDELPEVDDEGNSF